MRLLDDLVDSLPLLSSDREKLQSRGFSNETIDAYKFRSCHPHNSRALSELETRHGRDAMVEAKLLLASRHDPMTLRQQKQLLQSNILIPYFDKDGHVVKVRPHKLGFKDDGAQVYRTYASCKKSLVCIIAESEFKAVAAECFGYAAIGVPGISSMAGKNWDYFVSVLEEIPTDEFVIVFDNEVKSNPKFSNYKKDWRKRYDTIIYAYAMCQKIMQQGGRPCKVATLPEAWMVDGKIDIDTALKLGYNKSEFQSVIQAALPPKAYLEKAPIDKLHRPFILRRINRFYNNSIITVRENAFWIKDQNNKDSDFRKLTNCTITIRNVYEELGSPDSNGVKRDIVITNEAGIESRPITITASEMASKGAFQTWLMSQGNYLFYGTDRDVIAIWEHVFTNDDGNIVYLINRCGFVVEHGFYLFKNMMLYHGTIIEPDENGIFWIEEIGYKPNQLTDEHVIPRLLSVGTFNMDVFIEYLSDTVDKHSPGMGKALIAWVFAVVFMEPIIRKYKMFPLLFLYGSRGSGKTTIMRWLMSFFGLSDATTSLAQSTSVGIQRLLSYYSGLPVVVDDWRDDNKSRSFVTLFLGVYNRQSGAKGVKKNFGIAQNDIRAALTILGEEMINDNGLQTRCLAFYIPSERKQERYEEIEEMISESSSYVVKLLGERYGDLQTVVLSETEKVVRTLRACQSRIEPRLLFNYSILYGAYTAVIGRHDSELYDYIYGRLQEGQREITEMDKIHRFAQEFTVGLAEGIVTSRHYKWSPDNNVLYLWIKGIVDVMNRFYHRGIDSSHILTKHFCQQSYCLGTYQIPMKDVGKVPCVGLLLDKLPEDLRDAFASAPRLMVYGEATKIN